MTIDETEVSALGREFSTRCAVALCRRLKVVTHAIAVESRTEVGGRSAGSRHRQLTVPQRIVPSNRVTDQWVMPAQQRRYSERDWRAATHWGVLRPNIDDRTAELCLTPRAHQSILAKTLREGPGLCVRNCNRRQASRICFCRPNPTCQYHCPHRHEPPISKA